MRDSVFEERYEKWEAAQPELLRTDVLWALDSYRLALYLVELSTTDMQRARDGDLAAARRQLLKAVISISANIAEGYSRPTLADRSRFFAYALGSAREAVTWYASFRISLGDATLFARYTHLARLRRILIATQRNQHYRLPPNTFTPGI
jgi:four helix bundle protein